MDKKIKGKDREVKFYVAEVGEDATKYGEFISSYFAWVSLPEQKKRVEELEKMTIKDNREKMENVKKKRDKERSK